VVPDARGMDALVQQVRVFDQGGLILRKPTANGPIDANFQIGILKIRNSIQKSIFIPSIRG
jgi:hypothetical protein